MSRYSKSEAWLNRAENSIPLGSQTFSKSRTQYPLGISPLFIEKGNGSRVWDVDGNEYVDLVNALASVTLGYNHRGMNRAIRKQLKKGISLTLPGKLEAVVAEKLIELIPSAEMVRFGKNGSDATSAAIRLARAYTGRDRIAVCGYHGWQDWYIGSTSMSKGIPKSVKGLTQSFAYNDIDSLKTLLLSHPNEFAAVIMEPMNSVYPRDGYLESVKKVVHEQGALLVFDETITGFRFAKGGAQELFAVTPDLSTFGKGLANGMPVSAIVGRSEVMLEMEKVFFSGTFGGELLSLAAANFVLDQISEGRVIEKICSTGTQLMNELNTIIEANGLNAILKLSGHPSWVFLNWYDTVEFTAQEIRTFFMQEMFARGVLVLSTHNVSCAIDNRDLERILRSYSETLRLISNNLEKGTLREALKVSPLTPLFKVR
ncbi:HemL Glutamate-1-semialdehyde aminotransferase [Candidatus Nanopelagicaceae bacterium]